MGYVIIRMPDGSYAKIPAEHAPAPPPPPPTLPRDWVTRPEFEEEISRLQQTDQELQEQIDQLKEEDLEFEEEISRLQQTDQELQEQINLLKEEDLEFEEEISRLQQTDQELQEQINLLKEEDLEFEEEISRLQQTDEELQEQIDQLKEEDLELQEEISRLQQTDQELQGQIDQLKEDQEDVDHRIDEIVEQVGSITDQIQDIVGDITGDVIDRVQALEDKRLIIAIRETTTDPVTDVTYQARYEGGQIQPGYLTVLNADGSKPAFTPDGTPVHGSISENGVITLNHPPNAPVTFVFSAEVSFLEMPRDAFQQHFVTELERKTQLILDVDRIDRELEIQEITPSALSATSVGDNVYLTFAYKDSPKLSHFIIEVQDPDTGQWIPYDGASGVVDK